MSHSFWQGLSDHSFRIRPPKPPFFSFSGILVRSGGRSASQKRILAFYKSPICPEIRQSGDNTVDFQNFVQKCTHFVHFNTSKMLRPEGAGSHSPTETPEPAPRLRFDGFHRSGNGFWKVNNSEIVHPSKIFRREFFRIPSGASYPRSVRSHVRQHL